MRHSYYAPSVCSSSCSLASVAADDKDAGATAVRQVPNLHRMGGVEGHRASFDKTASGQMMKGDTGLFVTGVFGQLQESIGSLLTVNQLLTGTPPDKLQKPPEARHRVRQADPA